MKVEKKGSPTNPHLSLLRFVYKIRTERNPVPESYKNSPDSKFREDHLSPTTPATRACDRWIHEKKHESQRSIDGERLLKWKGWEASGHRRDRSDLRFRFPGKSPSWRSLQSSSTAYPAAGFPVRSRRLLPSEGNSASIGGRDRSFEA